MVKHNNGTDNVEKMKNNVQNTSENLEGAQDYLTEHADEISGQEISNIKNKNANRRQNIESTLSEINDEASDQK